MHASAFDRFYAGDSLIHRLDPRVKVVVTVLFILSTVLLPDGAWLGFLLSWGLVLALSALSGLGIDFAFRRSFIALPFALAGLTAIFAIPGTPLAVWTLGPWTLVATDAGLLRFVSIVIRSWLSVQVAVLLVSTTQFPDVIHALGHLRMPRLLVAIISFMYRYMFVLVDETMRLLRARVAGNMVGQLFLRSYERSERVYAAMQARGFDGEIRAMGGRALTAADWAAFAVVAAGIVALALAGQLVLPRP